MSSKVTLVITFLYHPCLYFFKFYLTICFSHILAWREKESGRKRYEDLRQRVSFFHGALGDWRRRREKEDASRDCGAIIAIGEIVGQLSRWQFYSPCTVRGLCKSDPENREAQRKGRERDARARFRYFPSTISWEFTVKSGPRGRWSAEDKSWETEGNPRDAT